MAKQSLAIVEIPEGRNYWFVRTQGGKWYDEFIAGRFIAIGWNTVTLDIIAQAKSERSLHEFIHKAFPRQKRYGLTATHMVRFVKEMCIGDIIVIPSQNGTEFAFGEIISDAFTHTGTIEEGKCDFIKRRRVNWLKRSPSFSLDPSLRAIKYAQPTVNTLNFYAELIDSELGGFLYTKGDLGYLVVRVEEKQEIRAKDLADFLTTSLDAIKKADPTINIDDINIRLNVQSPGPIMWIAGPGIIFLLASVLYISTPGEYKMDINVPKIINMSCSMKTEGLIEAYRKYDEQKFNQEILLLREQQKKLGIKLPEPADPTKVNKTNDEDSK